MKRNLKTKLLSVLLAIAMVITSITVWPEQKEVKAALDYVELTFSDFGFEDGVYAAGSMKRNESITSLDGVAITGDLLLQTCSDAHQGLQLDATDGGWTTFQIYRAGEGGNTIVLTHWGATCETQYIGASELGITDFTTTKIRTRMCFDKTSDTAMTATVTMSVGDKTATRTLAMENVANLVSNENGYRIGPGESASAVGFYSVERDYKTWTFSDFGMEDGTYKNTNGGTKFTGSITGLDGFALEGDVNFAPEGPHMGLRLRPVDNGDDWGNFQVYRSGTFLVVACTALYSYVDKSSGQTASYFSTDDLKVSDLSTTTVRMKLCFDKRSDTTLQVKTTMTVGEVSVTRTGIISEAANLISSAGGYQIGPGGSIGDTGVSFYSVKPEPRTITFSDLGIADGNYAETYIHGALPSDIASWDNVTVVGNVTMPSSDSGAYIGWAGTEEKVSGLKYFANTSTEVWFWNDLTGNNHVGIPSGKTDDNGNVLGAVTGESIKLSITFSYVGNDLKMVYVVNDTWVLNWTFGDTVDALGRKVVVSGNITVSSYTEQVEQEPITLTFSDLGIADGNYAGTYAHGELPENVTSWDNVTVVGNITMPSNDSGAYIGWAGTTDIASGLKYFANNSTETWYWNDLTKKNHVSVATGHTDEAGNVLGAITGESMKISVTFEIEGNDVNMIYVINDTWTLKWTFTETAEAMGRRLVVSGNVTVESIIEYTELTFCDLGIADGNYNNTSATGQLPVDVESWDKVAINGIIQLPKNNDGPFIAFGATDSVPEGIKLFGANGNQIWFWNNLTGETHQGFTEGQDDADGDILGTVQGVPFKIRLEFLEDGANLNVKLTINDEWDFKWTYVNMTEAIGRIVKVSGDVTVTSIVEYTELTFNDLGFADGNYSGKTVEGSLPESVDSWDKLAISGHLTFYGEGDGNAFRFGGVAANESVAMFYSGGQFWFWDNLTSNHQGLDASAGTTGAPIKMRMEFLEIGSDLRMTLYMNDAQVKVITYTNMPSIIGRNFSMTGNITVGLPKEPLAVSFNSFGLEANKILGMTTASTMVPENAETLDGMQFSGYVTFYENSSYGGQGKVSFGVNESGAGVDMWLDGSNVWFWDSTGGVQASGADNGGIGAFSVSDLGLTRDNLIGQELKVEVAFTYTDSGVEFYYSVNGHENTRTIAGFQNYIGTGVKVSAGNSAVAYRSSLGEQYSVANRLSAEGYKRVTVTDFTGLEYKSYNRTTATGTYSAENMDGTYLDMNVNFTDVMFVAGDGGQANILYGADDDGWEGIWIRSNAAENHFVICGKSIPYTAIGMSSMEDNLNVKIALKKAMVDTVDCYMMSAWVNEIQICENTQVVNGNIGNKLLVWSADTVNGVANTSTITFEPAEYKEVTNKPASYSLRGYNHTTVQNYLVTGDATVTKNGAAYTVTNNQISEPGDYTIVTTVASTAHRYTQRVSLYILGDVNLDGTAGQQADLDVLKEMIEKVPYKTTTAAQYAADIDNDGTVDKKDLELLTSVVDGTKTLTNVLKQYHVPALTYDFIGGDDVMPIGGYFGPYKDATRSYLTDEVYDLIKASGINIINHTPNDAGYELSYVREALELADRYGLGWFVSDYTLNPKINVLNNNAVNKDAATLTTAQLAAKLGLYSYYDSFLGSHIKDEPSYNGGDENQDFNMLDYYTDSSAQLNSFANTMGYINLPAEDARTINNYNSWITSWRTRDNYDELWSQYVTDSKPKVYSADDYQFFGDAGTDDAESYFRTLGKIRQESIDNSTPFWYYVQVGGDFDHDKAATDASKIASEAETYWCMNTALAFGAKGIEWFPTIQPQFFDGITDLDTESSVDRNGLILSDGTTSTYYNWVKTANAQIAAVDDVLMKATNKAIVATGTYAVREIEEEGCTTTASSYGKLTGVTASNTTQGAVVGCFDYRDTQAFYVMNYSVDGEQTITLTFDNNYDVRIVQDAVNTCGRTMSDKTITLTLGAGKGALVLLESTEDQVCYYCQTENADGDAIFKCQHGGVAYNAGAGELYGDIDINDKVNAVDLVRMKKVEAELNKLRFLGTADLNGDRIIDPIDVLYLRRHLVGWISEELRGV